jgi:hypothetical protein
MPGLRWLRSGGEPVTPDSDRIALAGDVAAAAFKIAYALTPQAG